MYHYISTSVKTAMGRVRFAEAGRRREERSRSESSALGYGMNPTEPPGGLSLEVHNIEFSCRPESDRYAPVRQTAFFLSRPHPGGQLQRFVMAHCSPHQPAELG